jgi:2-methylisocitrate lyase-like PEP mutase family enzyme
MLRDVVVAPGAYDALSARIIERIGFPAVYLTGAGITGAFLGMTDLGLITMTEIVQVARNVALAVGLPVICDADTGFGNALNVRRTVREFEHAGVAGIHIEDQVWPKRCGHFEGKSVIPVDEMAQKIRATWLKPARHPAFRPPSWVGLATRSRSTLRRRGWQPSRP